MLREAVLLSCLVLGFCTKDWNTTTHELHKNLNLKRYHGKMRMIGRSCKEIKDTFNDANEDGFYYLITESGVVYQTFCDMTTAGGGWTLVASVHENDIMAKCKQGDRWSTEYGDDPSRPEGDKTWVNRVTFGTVEAATSDDYKNPGYYDIEAKDVSVWHVPNDEEYRLWSNSSFLRYHTETNFLDKYGGNLFHLFKRHPVRQGSGECKGGSGIPIPIVYDEGNEESTKELYGPAIRDEIDPGYVTFSVFNSDRAPMAVCSGVRPTGCQPQYYCIGGGGYYPTGTLVLCGDFNAFDWTIFAGAGNYKAAQKMIDASMLLFYR